MKIIAGLGNPGKEYEHTRHNMGFDVIDELARRWHVTLWKEDMKAEIGQTLVNGEKVLLVKPLTYMNNSGEAGPLPATTRWIWMIFILSAMIWTCRRERQESVKKELPADTTGLNPSSPIWEVKISTVSASV